MPSEPRFKANAVRPPGLAKTADDVRKGALTNGAEIDNWLRWSQSNDPVTNRQWEWLAGQGFDRDAWVLDVWRSVRDDPKHLATSAIEAEVPWSFYQRHFFGWFLGRFDARAALAMFLDDRLAARLHRFLITVLVAVSWLSLGFYTTRLTPSLLVFLPLLILVALTGLYARRKGLPWYAYLNSLSPRLAAAVGIGYLFFFSAPHLVKILNDTWRPAWQLWLGVAALVSTAYVYLTFHISRRVHPRLPPGPLRKRSLAILALALAYASLGMLIAGPMLFSLPFLGAAASGQPFAVHADLPRLAFCAAVALNLGVLLQLAWDEKPLTEPL